MYMRFLVTGRFKGRRNESSRFIVVFASERKKDALDSPDFVLFDPNSADPVVYPLRIGVLIIDEKASVIGMVRDEFFWNLYTRKWIQGI